jgi:hypothetical protein
VVDGGPLERSLIEPPFSGAPVEHWTDLHNSLSAQGNPSDHFRCFTGLYANRNLTYAKKYFRLQNAARKNDFLQNSI